MHIQAIDLRYYHKAGQMFTAQNALLHQKSLPYLSVVQSVTGSYGIGIDMEAEQYTGAMGAFIAPPIKPQRITHYMDTRTDRMCAHWVFLDVLVNGRYKLDSLFDFPLILPKKHEDSMYHLINGIDENNHICDNMATVYQIVKILLTIGTLKRDLDPLSNDLTLFVEKHYREKITAAQIAGHFSISESKVFKKCKQFFGKSPANYINDIRLSQAAILLETTEQPIGAIGESVGFSDVFYFSKLFKRKYDVSPSVYRSVIKPRESRPYHTADDAPGKVF